jgi:hypothetical protein
VFRQVKTSRCVAWLVNSLPRASEASIWQRLAGTAGSQGKPLTPPCCLCSLHAWFTFLSYDRGCIMCREEYCQAVHLLRQFSANPQKARQYSSYDHWRADHLQHRRVEWNPQTSLQEPITASQQVRGAAAAAAAAGCYACQVLGQRFADSVTESLAQISSAGCAGRVMSSYCSPCWIAGVMQQ